jgi:autophagy-related protein 9
MSINDDSLKESDFFEDFGNPPGQNVEASLLGDSIAPRASRASLAPQSVPEVPTEPSRTRENTVTEEPIFREEEPLLDDVEQVPTTEIDIFISNVYKYFKWRGFKNILIGQIVNLVFFWFLVSFCIFLLTCVDIHGIMSIHDPSHFYQLSDYVHMDWLWHMHWYMGISTALFVIFFVWRVVRSSFDVYSMWKMKRFYNQNLQITDFEITTIRWQTVIERLDQYQKNARFYYGRDEMNAHHIANRIMKKDNYMIAMITNQLFDFSIPWIRRWWDYPLFTTSMEWNLQYGVMNFFFDERLKLKRDIMNPQRRDATIETLKKRVRLISIVNIVLLPFLSILYLFWALFEYGEQIYKSPSKLTKRTWNVYARGMCMQDGNLETLMNSPTYCRSD